MTNENERLVRCADCKFWNSADTYNVIPDDLKGKYGRCKSDGFNYEDPVDGRTDMLLYSDFEGYAAGFDTGADFACIHGTKRNDD
jgi:hypothetical protein